MSDKQYTGPDAGKDLYARFLAEGHEASRHVRDMQFEHGRVTTVIRRLGLQAGQRMLKHAAKQENRERLKFDDLLAVFPGFPFMLRASTLRGIEVPWGSKTTPSDYVVHADPHSLEPSRFKRFDHVPFVCAYVAAFTGVESDKKFGLVFPRHGFADGMVIHNDDTECFWSSGLSWVFKSDRGGRLYVQPFVDLLEGIRAAGMNWKLDAIGD